MLRACVMSFLLSCAPPGHAAAARRFARAPQAVSHAPARWYQIAPRGEEFTFQTPAVPQVYVTQREDDTMLTEIGGSRVTRQLTLHAYDDGAVYLVHLYKATSPKSVMRALVARSPVKATFVRDLKAEGLDGEEYEMKFESFYEKTRFIKSGKFLYELQAASRDAGDPTLARFLSSFKTGATNPAAAREATPLGEAAASEQTTPTAKKADAAPEDGGAQVFSSKEVTRKAAIVYRPEPLYTEAARRAEITGTIRLKFVLRSDGEVSNIVVVTRLPDGLNETAVAAARAVRFIPAEKDGHRVSQYVNVDYNYNLY